MDSMAISLYDLFFDRLDIRISVRLNSPSKNGQSLPLRKHGRVKHSDLTTHRRCRLPWALAEGFIGIRCLDPGNEITVGVPQPAVLRDLLSIRNRDTVNKPGEELHGNHERATVPRNA